MAPEPTTSVLLGVDVGGTFTDALLLVDGKLASAKVPSSRPQSQAVLAAAAEALAAVGCDADRVSRFVHGMTVATNALLERRGARVVVLTTQGFRDLLAIARQDRETLYTLYPTRSAPLVPRERCLTVRERVGPRGVEEPLTAAEIERVCAEVTALEPEAVAICLLWSFLEPAHEARLAASLEERLPGVPVIRSSELAPVFREYERLSTTVVDAYVTPATKGYLGDLERGCRQAGLPAPEIMQSSGGTLPLEQAALHAAPLLLSGPAGGVVATRLLGEALGIHSLLSFDMGGTSTDCAALVRSGGGSTIAMPTSVERTVAGHPVRLPMADIHTVSAGGGSVAWIDEGGALKVGPRSAGADPGPACYGWGGTEATVTDANVVLGRIAPGAAFGGSLRLDRGLAREAVARLGERVGLSPEEAAEGIVQVSAFAMAAALRAVTLTRGIDPREFTLVSFGGAGGLHACALAEEVDIGTVLVPLRAGVFSALGLVGSPLRADRGAAAAWPSGEPGEKEWQAAWAPLEAAVRDRLREEAPGAAVLLSREVEARYAGQSHELTVALDPEDGPAALAPLFHGVHAQRFDYVDRDSAVEAITLRVVGVVSAAGALPFDPLPRLIRRDDAPVWVGGQEQWCTVFQVAAAGEEGGAGGAGPSAGAWGPPGEADPTGLRSGGLSGPALISAAEFSAFVAAGWDVDLVPGALRLHHRVAAAGAAPAPLVGGGTSA